MSSETAFRIEGSHRLRSADSEVKDYRVAGLNSVNQHLGIRAALSGLWTQKSGVRIAGSDIMQTQTVGVGVAGSDRQAQNLRSEIKDQRLRSADSEDKD